jgi:hypothetical protein
MAESCACEGAGKKAVESRAVAPAGIEEGRRRRRVGAILNDHDLRLQRPLCDTETKRTSVGMKRRIEKDSLSFLILAMARKTKRCWVETYRPILSTMFPDLCLDHRGLRKEK